MPRGRSRPWRACPMSTVDDYVRRPPEQRLERLARTAEPPAAATAGRLGSAPPRQPDARSWAATEVICPPRDTEEVYGARFEPILAMDVAPALVVPDHDRLAVERQYLRNDANGALAAFRTRRAETL